MTITKTTTSRFNVVFIRKSTQGQDEGGQKANVENMLKERGVCVEGENWFVGTVSRRKVRANADFNRLMELVEADKVGTVYVESQDRWGTADRPELFSLLGTLRQHETQLYDLRAKKDLTEKDLATELLAFVGSIKSEKELQDIAYRSLRTRVANFLATGSWPTGTHPYGYGKKCCSADGKLLWVWQPVNRSRGQICYPDPSGNLTPGPDNVSIPRKDKRDIIKLVPSNNPDYVRAVKLIFDLYIRVGLSRRKISAQLNAEGLTFNGGPFTHTDITHILQNPAYMGDTHFGKVQTGYIHTFDAKGLITEVKRKPDNKHRDVSECLVKENTHEGLVDRNTWKLAQKKLSAEEERTSFSPRNPAYYLKQLFVCGHCGKGLTGRTETDQKTGKKTVIYVCPTYVAGRCNGHPVSCGYQRITHEDAERLLLDKVEELGLEFDDAASVGARANLEERLNRLGIEDDDFQWQLREWIENGVNAFLDYLKDTYPMRPESLQRLEKSARCLYSWGWLPRNQVAGLPATPTAPLPSPAEANQVQALTVEHKAALAEFKEAMQEAEEKVVTEARQTVAKLREEYTTYTVAWAKAPDLAKGVLMQEMERLEAEIGECQPRMKPVSERLRELTEAERGRAAEQKKLLAEWPALENREKGEALRRLFDTVTLYWERTFHPRMSKPPRTRPLKTNRPGRYSYALKREEIKWAFATTDLGSFS